MIQLLEFHNPMNIEERVTANEDVKYCCCDSRNSNCQLQPFVFDMNDHNCAEECDIFFVVSVFDGSSELPSISTIMGSIQDSPSDSFYGYIFPLTLDNFPSSVSLNKMHNICALKMHPFIYFVNTT